jgi:tripartite-type tricarboxylate transporter receptor subunit TctC
MELLQSVAGIKLHHIPYKGSSLALNDLVGGHVQLVASSISSATSLVHGGKVRALAVSSAKRSPALPDVPSGVELGYKDFVVNIYYGVLGPAGLPQPIVQRLNADINKILATPDARNALHGQGLEPGQGSPADFAALVRADIQKSKAIITGANIKVE